MSFYQMIKNGAKIEVKPHLEDMKCYDSALFYFENNCIVTVGKICGVYPRNKQEYPPDRFNHHIQQMINEHFQIVITP